MGVRRCPTLPQGPPCSTIGAERLSFRVRNGTGRFPLAMAAETLSMFPVFSQREKSLLFSCGFRPYIGNHSVDASILRAPPHRVGGMLSSHRLISTSQLHTLPCFHIWPINPVVWLGASHPKVWKSHLEAGFPLRCFQRLSIPNVANQRCTWQYNWHTRGSSNPVLSY